MKKESIFLILIILCVTIMVIYNQVESSVKIEGNNNSSIRWNNTQKNYLADRGEITLGIPEDLLYLLIEEEDGSYQQGFLYDYLTEIFRPTGKTLRLVPIASSILGVKSEDLERLDCLISEVTNPIRNQSEIIDFSVPILKTKGSLFVRWDFIKGDKSLDSKKPLSNKGLALENDLQTEKIPDLKYKGETVYFTSEKTIETMIERGLSEEWDFVAGNQQAIALALQKNETTNSYLDQGVSIYQRNVCIIVPKGQKALYSIISNLLNEQDFQPILTQLQGKWYGLPSSFVAESPFIDLFLVIIIIFGGVLGVFFIYYNSNKNLYEELRTRMEELVSSQNEMRTTFNGVSYLMAELDRQGTVLDINKAFLEFLDERRQDIIDKSFMDIWSLTNDVKQKITGAIEETSINKTSINLEINDRNQIFEVGVFPINNPKNQLEKILFIANDVTSVRAAKRQIIQDNKMIAVGQLAAGVAHEIRNPLGIIRNYCYLLKTMDPKDSEKRTLALQVIEKSVETSGNIINNLLNFSRISTSDKEVVWIKQHFDSILFLHEQKTLDQGIIIEIDSHEDFQVQILKESFNMILVNLISNAIDASTEGGEIKIKLKKKKDSFTVSVKDYGSGIPRKYMDSIYNPFFTTKTRKKGNGLGLYIVYNEVQKMNGTINLSSEEGYGTEFYLEFPLEILEGSSKIE
jgi:polar amino acid transport system substrate-binding protein